MPKKDYGYTLVQHSGYGYGGKPEFKHAVEERHITSKTDNSRVQKAGGVIYPTYVEAYAAAERVNYPKDRFPDNDERPITATLVPHCHGTFSSIKIDDLAIWVPPKP